jgi:prepilin peptidase CpaA
MKNHLLSQLDERWFCPYYRTKTLAFSPVLQTEWNIAGPMNVKIDPLLLIFISSILIVAAIIDIRSQKIPNLLTFPTMLVGLVFHSAVMGWDGLLFSTGGLTLGIALFIIPYLMGGMGAGDAKLVGAVGATIGAKGVLIASLLIAIAGGIYTLVVFLFNISYLRDFATRNAIMLKTFAYTKHLIPIPSPETEKKPKLCYGVAIAIGSLVYILLEFFGYKFPV